MPRRPQDHSIGVGSFLFALLFLSNLPLFAGAQQQRPKQNEPLLAATPRGKSTWPDAIPPEDDHWPKAASSYEHHRSTAVANNRNNKRNDASTDVRAIATLAPADGSGPPARAVRAPPAQGSTGPTGGLSRLQARSLQDWEVEDLVLLATVDGSLHARDRKTGSRIWELESTQPMVETIYHPRNKSLEGSVQDEFLWIVEPSQDGSLYGYTPGSPYGMQKLHLTVKQLEELSPYEAEEPPLVYTGQKMTTLYTIDVKSGRILKSFPTTGNATGYEPASCRKRTGLEDFEEKECSVSGSLTLGRTEYTIDIHHSQPPLERICTIKYAEWGANNRNKDLMEQYYSSKDNRYIYSKYDGSVLALDHLNSNGRSLDSHFRATFTQKLESPVARVFDVVRSVYDESPNPILVILPQPIGPTPIDDMLYDDGNRVFVNCTETGSWYALSEDRYPLVTNGARRAQSTQDQYLGTSLHSTGVFGPSLKQSLVGVHDLSDQLPEDLPQLPLIGAPPEPPTIDAAKDVDSVAGAQSSFSMPSYFKDIFFLTVFLCTVIAFTAKTGFNLSSKGIGTASFDSVQSPEAPQVVVPDRADKSIVDKEGEGQESAMPKTVTFDTSVVRDVEEVSAEATNSTAGTQEQSKLDGTEAPDATPQKKKKAHRGKRGGKKQLDKREGLSPSPEQLEAGDGVEEGVVKQGQEVLIRPDVVSTSSTEASEKSGLQNLHIHTDKVLGTGSGGTFVFEGQFENRDVAVKRMLPQHFELASQEVTLLEQSEEHPNVIRYFCRREDQHFLYIALELCQASLWDLFRDGRHDEAPNEKFTTLADEIGRDPRRVLRQLAEGVKYLHSFRIVHRDIKPQNMLIAYPKKNSLWTFPRLVISDFGLCKTLPENASTLIGTTGNAGTAGWKAPELILQPRETLGNGSQHSTGRSESQLDSNGKPINGISAGVKRAVDIFSLGCVFFYVLTHGQHPFDDDEGWMQLRERNIKTGRANLGPLELLGPDTMDLVSWMLSHQPEDRPTASQVLSHPFFWDAEDRLEFLSTASDRFDQEARDGTSEALYELEKHAKAIIPTAVAGTSYASVATHSHLQSSGDTGLPNGMATTMPLPIREPNFLAALDRKFVDTLGRQRKYHPGKLVDLLRALRNKHHHWDDMPDEVKAKVGEVPEGYLRYWESRFPALVVSVWRTMMKLGISQERRFARWFVGKGNTVG